MGEHIELIWDTHLFQTLLTTGLLLSLEMFDGFFWEGDCFLGAVLGSCVLSCLCFVVNFSDVLDFRFLGVGELWSSKSAVSLVLLNVSINKSNLFLITKI
ncbi:hypothetical protein LguiA_004731 [Lonicera macranthoides]